MPELTIVSMQQCMSLSEEVNSIGGYVQTGLGSEQSWPRCSCLAYKYNKAGTTNFGGLMLANPCKHILKHQRDLCGWHQQYSIERQTDEQSENMECPLCGETTEWVQVGV